MFVFEEGKALGQYLGGWENFVGCQALFKREPVTIHRVYRSGTHNDRYVDVIHNASQEIWHKVHPMSLIPMESREDAVASATCQ